MTQPKSKRPVFQLVLLGLLLLVFPIGSFLYLRAGYKYQVSSWDEIDPQGPVASVLSYARPDSTLDIVYFAEPVVSDSVRQALASVHDAFDDNPSVRFVGLGAGAAGVISDVDQAYVLESLTKGLDLIEQDLAPYSTKCAGVPFAQRAYLVDRAGQVRRCYDLHSGVEVNRLVEQLALLIPRPKEQDIVLERKTEL